MKGMYILTSSLVQQRNNDQGSVWQQILSVCAPTLQNDLTDHLRVAIDLPFFKHDHKTQLLARVNQSLNQLIKHLKD